MGLVSLVDTLGGAGGIASVPGLAVVGLVRILDAIGRMGVSVGVPAPELRVLGFTEIASAQADVTVSLPKPYRYGFVLARIAGYSGGGGIARFRFNGDTGNNYGTVASEPSDAAATATVSTDGIRVGETAQTTPRALEVGFFAKDAAGRIGRMTGIGLDDSEAIATALVMTQWGGIWGNTADLITSITLNGGGVNLLAGSNLLVFGIDVPTV